MDQLDPLMTACGVLFAYAKDGATISDTHLADAARQEWQEEGFTEHRKNLHEFITVNLKDATAKYNLKEKNVLEIGAGNIKDNESFLSSKLPHHSWTFSDFHPEAAIEHPKQYIQLDLIETSSEVNSLFDCIVGSSVLDTLPYDKLQVAIQNIFQRLHANGLFIHYANLEFYGSTFIDAIIKQYPDCLFLPAGWHSLYKINKDDFQRILKEKANSLSQFEKIFFNFWGIQRSVVQGNAIWAFNGQNVDGKDHLFIRIKKIFSTNLEKISSNYLFVERLKQAAESQGFKIEMCGPHQSIIPTNPEKIRELSENAKEGDNCCVVNQTSTHTERCDALEAGAAVVRIEAHFFIARKA
jgi:hypothetical protein